MLHLPALNSPRLAPTIVFSGNFAAFARLRDLNRLAAAEDRQTDDAHFIIARLKQRLRTPTKEKSLARMRGRLDARANKSGSRRMRTTKVSPTTQQRRPKPPLLKTARSRWSRRALSCRCSRDCSLRDCVTSRWSRRRPWRPERKRSRSWGLRIAAHAAPDEERGNVEQ